MVVYILSLKADLDNVEAIRLKPNADICLSVRNPLDHNETREKIVVDRRDFEDDGMDSSNNSSHRHHPKHAEVPCHFALKWDGATARSTIRVFDASHEQQQEVLASSGSKKKMKRQNSLLPNHNLALQMTSKDNNNGVRFLALECQDIEPYAFHLMGNELEILNKAGTTFHEDLTWSENGDWTTYDVFTGTTSVTNLKGEFE